MAETTHAQPLQMPRRLTRPGLFITATDTGVGKTVVTCAIAEALGRSGRRVGVCKPLASGCRREREGLVSDDAEALAHFADCRHPLDVINPIRYHAPLAPAVAAEQTGRPADFNELWRSLATLASDSDVMIIEGVGGLLVPLTTDDPPITVLDLIRAIGYPTVVVTRATLGTLNHTAMTVQLLRAASCSVAGLVINGYQPDAPDQPDASMASNPRWLARLTGVPVLATVPQCPAEQVAAERATLPSAIREAVGQVHWAELVEPAGASGSPG